MVDYTQREGGMESKEVRDFWARIPFKRSIIGEERSVPNKTTVWFITDCEYTRLRVSLNKPRRQNIKGGGNASIKQAE